MATTPVNVTFRGSNETDDAANKARANLKSIGDAAKNQESTFKSMGKVLAGAFAVDKLLQFGKESLKLASESNPALKKSLQGIENQFKGLQVGVGNAILGNKELMSTLTSLANVVVPVVVNAIQLIVASVNIMVSVIKMGFTNISILFKLITGELTLKQAWDAYKANAVNTFDAVKSTALTTWDSLKQAWSTDYAVVGASVPTTGKPTKPNPDDAFKPLEDRIKYFTSLKFLSPEQQDILYALMGDARKGQIGAAKSGNFKLAKDLEDAASSAEKALGIIRTKGPLTGINGSMDAFNNSIASGVRANANAVDVSQVDTSFINTSGITKGLDFSVALSDNLGPLRDFTDQLTTMDSVLGEITGQTLQNFQSAFSDAFEAIGGGAPVFDSLANAAKKAISQTAAFEGRQEFARGAAALAKGIGGAPNAFPQAAQHFAAGALFMALAGASGGSGGRGGGGTSGAISDRDNVVRPESLVRSPTVFRFAPGAYLTSDPLWMEAFTNSFNEAVGSNKIILEVGN